MKTITKRQLRQALNAESETEIATFFGISPSAVSQWPEAEPIPELRQLQAERKRPDLFAGDDSVHRATAAAGGSAAAETTGDPSPPLSEAA